MEVGVGLPWTFDPLESIDVCPILVSLVILWLSLRSYLKDVVVLIEVSQQLFDRLQWTFAQALIGVESWWLW